MRLAALLYGHIARYKRVFLFEGLGDRGGVQVGVAFVDCLSQFDEVRLEDRHLEVDVKRSRTWNSCHHWRYNNKLDRFTSEGITIS